MICIRIEQDRIDGQHLVIKKMLGGKLFESPVVDILERGTKVLDSGCGKMALHSRNHVLILRTLYSC